ncbi:bifunctional hydroxymethylpyrimidine kinase/phosphomethylpyrimidine kinase [Glaciimonas soli]|uniref:hydroxymethylpyrimidine kinase n=1 Tax=Glaciimonas soli TaxID=2590999 RepID=A0A843YUG4_9BURK|nr:hydroxymethylpyrimidine/phosphomethylpyrimidine kinase [Glaciimonas soli]MQR01344.1 hydroxymethylpyrimidine/phosphomethylpyrimidine kinase [Glaciimonas soli]
MQNQTSPTISPLILTFGVADPVGASGIQADLATFAAMGCHGLSAITSILIGDTARIEDTQEIDADWVADQARVLLEDMQISAFKVGAVGSIESVSVIAEIVSDYPEMPLILDPFLTMMPDQGQDSEDLLTAIRELLIPQTTVMFVSAVELSRLAETWREPSTEDMCAVDAMHIIGLGCEFLFVTGTPSNAGTVSNILFNDTGIVRQDSWQRVSGAFIGAGTTLSAATAAMLANGLDVPEAVTEAQEFTLAAVTAAQRIGMGKLVPDRFFWAREDNPGNPDAVDDGDETSP